MDFIEPLANDYIAHYSDATPAYLKDMYMHTHTTHPQAHLQSNWHQGGFLSFLSKLIQPSAILEIGTFTGFSALCLASGLASNGMLHTIELRAADAATAKEYFQQFSKPNQIELHVGDAKEIIPTIEKEWDLIFIDADKTSYFEYYQLVLPRLKKNGLIIVDNVLFHGQVLQPPITGKNAQAIHAFNEAVLKDASVEKTMLTIRDGLTLIRKKDDAKKIQ